MSNSNLVCYTKLSPNCTRPRNHSIDKITIHYMAGSLSVENCGNLFANSSRQASSNYGIGSDGRIGLYVNEADRSWCSSNKSNDHRAVTIECANKPDSSITDAAMESLINLCVDICKRNNIKQLNYTGDTSGNLTMHCMFANTSCPGAYLKSKFPEIAKQVNTKLNQQVSTQPSQKDVCIVELNKLSRGSKGNSVKALQLILIGNGYFCGAEGADGKFGPATEKAVRAFQQDQDITVDGVVGSQTYSKLLK